MDFLEFDFRQKVTLLTFSNYKQTHAIYIVVCVMATMWYKHILQTVNNDISLVCYESDFRRKKFCCVIQRY